jgi:hypothetical protein
MRINIRRIARLRCGSIIDEIRLGAVDFTPATALCKSAVAAVESIVPKVIRFTRLMQPCRGGSEASTQIIALTGSDCVHGESALANDVPVSDAPGLNAIRVRSDPHGQTVSIVALNRRERIIGIPARSIGLI